MGERDSTTKDRLSWHISTMTPVKSEDLKTWMASDDIDILGMVFVIIGKGQDLLIGHLGPEETVKFYIMYLFMCIVEDPRGDYTQSRFVAAHTFSNIYKILRRDEGVPRELLLRMRVALRKLYQTGDEEVRNCVVQGILEHLFEEKSIRAEFAEWLLDPNLSDAYHQAITWSKAQ